ncbi:MAG: AAA family ATPase [Nostoc sp.]|uniref:AAA family ATPase n=1 Tax=Nostoc sp. TaxID=1180 RepID=UPI002FF470A5
MNIDPVSVVNAIKAIAPATVSLGIQQAQRNEYIIKVLKRLNLDPIQPPKDFEGVYTYALVDYGVFQADDILNFFRNKEIKKTFYKAFAEKALTIDNEEWNTLKDEAQQAKIDLVKVQKFHQVFVSVAKRSRHPGEILTNVQLQEQRKTFTEPLEQSLYPDEFKALIEEKTKAFCGRVFVFNEFDAFLKKHPKGYFTVIGDAGMGKSAIAAQSVSKYKAICYFNIRAEGRNTPEQFLQSIRQQLINRYQLQNAENDNLPTLLTKVNKKFASGERLVIVVDALDEVEQSGSGNLLSLPKNLPERIYFLLTRRRYAQNEKRLLTEEVPEQQLDLTANEYRVWNRNDVREYIDKFINYEPEGHSLKAWIQQRKIEQLDFVEQVARKSENNFMYLYYVLPSIARGDYQDLSLEELPEKLQGYYEQHWKQMEMDTPDKRTNAIILCVLVEVGKPISCESIARITKREEYDVLELLNKWLEFLRKQKENQEDYYSIYHQSFADFLRNQPTLKREKKNNIDWPEVQLLISDYNDQLWKSLKSGKGENE